MRNVYEVIGSFSYVNIRGAELLKFYFGDERRGQISKPKTIQVVHTANFLAEDAEEAIAQFKLGVDGFAEEHHYSNGGDKWATELVVKTPAIESVALLAVGVHE